MTVGQRDSKTSVIFLAPKPMKKKKKKKSFDHRLRSFIASIPGLRCHRSYGPVTSTPLSSRDIIYRLHLDNIAKLRKRVMDFSWKDDGRIWDDRIPKDYVTDMQRQLLNSRIKRSKERLAKAKKGKASTSFPSDTETTDDNEEEEHYMKDLKSQEKALPQSDFREKIMAELSSRHRQSLKRKSSRRQAEKEREIRETHRKTARKELLARHRRKRMAVTVRYDLDKHMLRCRIRDLQKSLDSQYDPKLQKALNDHKHELINVKLKLQSEEEILDRSQKKELDKTLRSECPEHKKLLNKRYQFQCKETTQFNKWIKTVAQVENNLLKVTPKEKYLSSIKELRKNLPTVIRRRRQYSKAFNDIYCLPQTTENEDSHLESTCPPLKRQKIESSHSEACIASVSIPSGQSKPSISTPPHEKYPHHGQTKVSQNYPPDDKPSMANQNYPPHDKPSMANQNYQSYDQSNMANQNYQSYDQSSMANQIYQFHDQSCMANQNYQSYDQSSMANQIYQFHDQSSMTNQTYQSYDQSSKANQNYQSYDQSSKANQNYQSLVHPNMINESSLTLDHSILARDIFLPHEHSDIPSYLPIGKLSMSGEIYRPFGRSMYRDVYLPFSDTVMPCEAYFFFGNTNIQNETYRLFAQTNIASPPPSLLPCPLCLAVSHTYVGGQFVVTHPIHIICMFSMLLNIMRDEGYKYTWFY